MTQNDNRMPEILKTHVTQWATAINLRSGRGGDVQRKGQTRRISRKARACTLPPNDQAQWRC